jgi:hypothetical protein
MANSSFSLGARQAPGQRSRTVARVTRAAKDLRFE